MHIHFVGIRGVSMNALAKLAASRGHYVTGSDKSAGGHDISNASGADLVVYTNAVPLDNCELVYARKNGIPAVERATYLGELARTYRRTIAVAGCHGKSTTTAMLGAAFAPLDPTVHVGVADGSHIGSDALFITEACEYRRSFLHLSPTIGIILNIGYDHPDCYDSYDKLIDAYKAFYSLCDTVIINGDDELVKRLFPDAISYGTKKGADYLITDITSDGGHRSFFFNANGMRTHVRLSVAGEHNVYNAAAALSAVALSRAKWGAPDIRKAAAELNGFYGIPRRFEQKGIAYGKTIISDYAHHPDEIAATIATAREIFPSVAVVFQPHTYSRTAALRDGFIRSLCGADTVILAPVYAARESDDMGISSAELARALIESGARAYCFNTSPELISACKRLNEKAVIFMGAGDIDKLAERFVSSYRIT